MEYKDITIEKQDVNFTFSNPVRVYDEEDISKLIGSAFLRKEEGKIVGNLVLKGNYSGKYPCIGYALKGNNGVIYSIGLTTGKNKDSSIQPL